MPALPVLANAYRIALKWAGNSQSAVNVIHIEGPVAGSTSADIFELLQDTITAGMWTPVQVQQKILEVDITPLDGATATTSYATGGGAQWTGGTAGDFLPAVSALIKLSTSQRGRSRRGRVFLPFISENVVANGDLDGATATGVSAAWATFLTALQGDATTPSDLIVASYKIPAKTTVLTAVCEGHLATQRRRQQRLRV